MSPIVMKKGEKFTIPSKYLLFILTFICGLMILISYNTDFVSRVLNRVAGVVIVPFEKGISNAGIYLSSRADQLKQINELLEENAALKEQVDQLTIENTQMQQDRYELTTLRELYQLDTEYDQFEMTGAHVIARDSGNWYYSFVIDKGEEDGIQIDMNVMAGAGLVGRVVSVGKDWAKIKAIIADDSNVSSMVLSTQDNMMVSGSLELYSQGKIEFTQLLDTQDAVNIGDKVVTSNISNKFLPGILIGYISDIAIDSNNLTKSGTITPAVDFEHIEEVLIIMKQKQVIETNEFEDIDE